MNRARRFLAEELDVSFTGRIRALLSYDGIKPSSFFRYDGQEDLNPRFEELGIHAKLETYKEDHKVIFVAKDDGILEQIIVKLTRQLEMLDMGSRGKAWSKEFDLVSSEMGTLLGYPKTAVEAFLGMRPQRLYEESETRSFRRIRAFVPSDKHYDEEMKVVKGWVEHISSNYPLLYIDFVLDSL